jgi:hypothetical protein
VEQEVEQQEVPKRTMHATVNEHDIEPLREFRNSSAFQSFVIDMRIAMDDPCAKLDRPTRAILDPLKDLW